MDQLQQILGDKQPHQVHCKDPPQQVLGHEQLEQALGNVQRHTGKQKLVVKAQYQFMGKMVSTIATWECVPLHCLPMPQQISGVQRHNSPKVRPRWTTDLPLVETSGREVEDQEGMWHPSQPCQSRPTSPWG